MLHEDDNFQSVFAVPRSRLLFFGLLAPPKDDEVLSFDARLSLFRFLFSDVLVPLFFRCSSLISNRRWTSSEMSSVSIDTGVTPRMSSLLLDNIERRRFLFCEEFSCALSVVIFVASFSALALLFPVEKFDFAVAAVFASPGVVDSDRDLLPNETNKMLYVPSVEVFELRPAHHFSVRMLA